MRGSFGYWERMARGFSGRLEQLMIVAGVGFCDS